MEQLSFRDFDPEDGWEGSPLEEAVKAKLRLLRTDMRWLRLHNGADPELVRAFMKFDETNPELYRLFAHYSEEALAAGWTRGSHWLIFNRIRWYTEIETAGDEFKVNNNWLSMYARKLIYERPKFEGFFELRSLVHARSAQAGGH